MKRHYKNVLIFFISTFTIAILVYFISLFKNPLEMPYKEPEIEMKTQNFPIPVKQQTHYLPLNCVSYQERYFSYEIIISKSILRSLKYRKIFKKNNRFDIGNDAEIVLNNLGGFDSHGCQKVNHDNGETLNAILNISKEVVRSGNSVVLDKNGSIQPTVTVQYEMAGGNGGFISFLINNKSFLGYFPWYVV